MPITDFSKFSKISLTSTVLCYNPKPKNNQISSKYSNVRSWEQQLYFVCLLNK